MTIIDAQFDQYSYFYHMWLLIIYVLFFCVPFILQLDFDHYELVIGCNVSCLIVCITFLTLIKNDYSCGRYKKFTEMLDFMTVINIGQYVVYICYFIWRVLNSDSIVLPNDPTHEQFQKETILALVHFYIILGMIFKIMDIIQYTSLFQNFVKLVAHVIVDVSAYLFFLILWVLIFAFFYQALGVGKGQDLSIFDYLSDSWTMSTKGGDNLSSDYWIIGDKENHDDDYNKLIVYSHIMTNFVSAVKYIN